MLGLTIAVSIFALSTSAYTVWLWGSIVPRLDSIKDQQYDIRKLAISLDVGIKQLHRDIQLLEANERATRIWLENAATLGNPKQEIVTCGGCGASVETLDGFNPVAHDCDINAK